MRVKRFVPVFLILLCACAVAGPSNGDFLLGQAEKTMFREVWKQVEHYPATGTFKDILLDTGHKQLYLADYDSNSIHVFSTESLAFAATVPVGPKPKEMDMSPDGTRLYVCNTGGETITEVDLTKSPPAPLRTLALPLLEKRDKTVHPNGLAVMKNGKALLLLRGEYSSEKIGEMDLASGSVKEVKIPNVFLRGGSQLLTSPDRNIVFLAESGGSLFTYFPSKGQFNEGKSLGNPSLMAVNCNGSRLIAQVGGATRILDWNGTVMGEIPYSHSSNASGQVRGVAFNPVVPQEAYRAREGHSADCHEVKGHIDVIDANRGTISYLVPLPDKPSGPMTVNAVGNVAYCVAEKGLCVIFLTVPGEKGFF
jgi:hypothetical protein